MQTTMHRKGHKHGGNYRARPWTRIEHCNTAISNNGLTCQRQSLHNTHELGTTVKTRQIICFTSARISPNREADSRFSRKCTQLFCPRSLRHPLVSNPSLVPSCAAISQEIGYSLQEQGWLFDNESSGTVIAQSCRNIRRSGNRAQQDSSNSKTSRRYLRD
jgi:hypothetical protein